MARDNKSDDKKREDDYIVALEKRIRELEEKVNSLFEMKKKGDDINRNSG